MRVLPKNGRRNVPSTWRSSGRSTGCRWRRVRALLLRPLTPAERRETRQGTATTESTAYRSASSGRCDGPRGDVNAKDRSVQRVSRRGRQYGSTISGPGHLPDSVGQSGNDSRTVSVMPRRCAIVRTSEAPRVQTVLKKRLSDQVSHTGPHHTVAAGRCAHAKHHRESSVDTPTVRRLAGGNAGQSFVQRWPGAPRTRRTPTSDRAT
jgi:hypothetical protein